jgi:hypothetical protein
MFLVVLPLRWLSHRNGSTTKKYVKPEAAFTDLNS